MLTVFIRNYDIPSVEDSVLSDENLLKGSLYHIKHFYKIVLVVSAQVWYHFLIGVVVFPENIVLQSVPTLHQNEGSKQLVQLSVFHFD